MTFSKLRGADERGTSRPRATMPSSASSAPRESAGRKEVLGQSLARRIWRGSDLGEPAFEVLVAAADCVAAAQTGLSAHDVLVEFLPASV